MPELITIEKLEPVAWQVRVGKYEVDFDCEAGESETQWIIWAVTPHTKSRGHGEAPTLEEAVIDANAALANLMREEVHA